LIIGNAEYLGEALDPG